MPPLWKTEELNLSTLQEVKSQRSYANLLLHLKSDEPSWFTAMYRTSQLERNPISVQTFRALHHPCPKTSRCSLWHPAFHYQNKIFHTNMANNTAQNVDRNMIINYKINLISFLLFLSIFCVFSTFSSHIIIF